MTMGVVQGEIREISGPLGARIASGSVLVDQSMLTGEAVPVEVAAGGTVYAGGLVRRGQANAEVTATGAKSYFGRAAELVRIAKAESTEQTAVLAVTRNLSLINSVVALLTIAAGYVMALPIHELFRLALTAEIQVGEGVQSHGHVVGMCSDGTNDAPALRQAQIGIAVASATDVAKAAAGMVLTEPGLGGIASAVREGRMIPSASSVLPLRVSIRIFGRLFSRYR
ncbi:hypothetical protein XH88_34745 [Bradyrhizobium sp. CCBAU 51627]|nr:hypothetical protein [Bradyrhizobium sp. CCBAU 51627]